MSDETTLLPCAHCGGKGELVFYYDFYHVNCTNDDCVEHYDEGMIYRGEGAWYGSVADAIAAWNTRTHGMLTADDVLNAVYKHGARWQAIADELNAELGSGTCRIEHRGMGYYCSECDSMVGSDDVTSELYIDANAIELWSFCPHCGTKAVDDVRD